MSRKTAARKRNAVGDDVSQGRRRAVVEGSALRLGELSSRWCWSQGLCERRDCEPDSRGRGAQSLSVMESQGKRARSSHRKLFYPCPPTFAACLLRLTPTAALFKSGGFALILCRLLTPGALLIFQLVSGCFSDIVTSTRRCAFPPRLKVIVTPGLKSRQPCLSPWAATCN